VKAYFGKSNIFYKKVLLESKNIRPLQQDAINKNILTDQGYCCNIGK